MDELRIEPSGWPAAVAATDGPQLVVGGPGTGKTEFLVRRAVGLLEAGLDPAALLVLGFSRRGIGDLRSRIEGALGRSATEVAASTFHSFAFRLLEAHAADVLGWEQMPSLLTALEQVEMVGALLRDEDPARWPVPFRPLLSSPTFAAEVADFIMRCQERLVAADGLRAADRAEWRGLAEFMDRYAAELKARARIDYATLLAQAVRLLGEPAVAARIGDQYRYVLVDEYQDTTAAQARLLQGLYQSHRNLTVAADPYQSIYSFRGAELINVAAFPESFPDADGNEARRLVLTTSFRVPAAILEAAVRVTAGSELPGSAGEVTPAPGRGLVDVFGFGQETEEAEWIAAEVQRLHLEQGLPYRKMGVFVRSKRRFLPELSRTLDRLGVPHDRPDSRLSDHSAVRLVSDCVTAATAAPAERSRAIHRILTGSLYRFSIGKMRQVERERIRVGTSWPQLLQSEGEAGQALGRLIDDDEWACRLPAAEGLWHVWTTLPQFAEVATEPARHQERQAWASLSQVLRRTYERDPAVTLATYLEWTEEEDFEATPLLSYEATDSDRLVLTTLHQSKGLEFEVVFIADAVEGAFPDLRRRDSLLGARHLTFDGSESDYRRFRLQEETRLAYTAMVRAARRAVWTATSSGIEEGHGMPSRFLARVAGVDEVSEALRLPPEWSEPTTPLEAESWLRRIAADPAEPAGRRRAAVSLLARGDDFRMRPVASFAGLRTRGPDGGLLSEPVTLSPSQAESYDRCPRRYALERRLGVAPEQTLWLDFGSLIHAVLEKAETLAAARGAVHAELEVALAVLDDTFSPERFGGPPFAESWRRRAARQLTRFYETWPGRGPAVALEHELIWDLEGVAWRGKADRIESVDDHLEIVDYKTSTSPVTKEEAATSLQLGFYALAAAADSHLTQHGPIGGASLWYHGGREAKSIAVRQLDMKRLDEVVARLAEAAAGITAEDWTPRPGPQCEMCHVRNSCPRWPEGQEAFVS